MTDDMNFDRMLEDTVTDLPPAREQTQEITPWRRAMSRIIWGIALTSVTFNFCCLHYILPVCGAILSCLGYRALRRENRYFQVCWWLSLYFAAVILLRLTLLATTLEWKELDLLGIPGLLLRLAEIFCLWKGIREVRCKANQPDSAGAAAALMVWYAIVTALCLIGAGGWLIMPPLLIGYVCILYNLSKLPALLDEAGYEVAAAPVRLPDTAVWVLYPLILLVCVSAAGVLSSRYPMQWEPLDPQEQTGYEETAERLLRQGMPEEVLADLSVEELEELQDSLWVYTEENYHTFTGYKNDERKIKFTHLAVCLPGDRLKIIHRFEWVWDPTIRTTECIKLWRTDRDNEGYRADGAVQGRLLYDMGGETFTGDYYRIEEETYDRQSTWYGFGGGVTTDTFILFSLPQEGERLRGYISYNTVMLDDGYLVNSWPNYLHQMTLFNYPMMTAEEYDKTGASNFDGCFVRAQTALQFRPCELNYRVDDR